MGWKNCACKRCCTRLLGLEKGERRPFPGERDQTDRQTPAGGDGIPLWNSFYYRFNNTKVFTDRCFVRPTSIFYTVDPPALSWISSRSLALSCFLTFALLSLFPFGFSHYVTTSLSYLFVLPRSPPLPFRVIFPSTLDSNQLPSPLLIITWNMSPIMEPLNQV